MVDVGVKFAFSRHQMIFNIDLEANFAQYVTNRYFRYVPAKDDHNENQHEKRHDSIKNHLGLVTCIKLLPPPPTPLSLSFPLANVSLGPLWGSHDLIKPIGEPFPINSGSFTFASVMEDFVSGSRINFNYLAHSWSKLFLFTGKEYLPFFPNLNPSFAKIAALEFAVWPVQASGEICEGSVQCDWIMACNRFWCSGRFSIIDARQWFHLTHDICLSMALATLIRHVLSFLNFSPSKSSPAKAYHSQFADDSTTCSP